MFLDSGQKNANMKQRNNQKESSKQKTETQSSIKRSEKRTTKRRVSTDRAPHRPDRNNKASTRISNWNQQIVSPTKLANVNRQANTVKDRKQKPKKASRSNKRDINLKKIVPSSKRNERKQSLRRGTLRKNEKNTLSKGGQESLQTTSRPNQKRGIRTGQGQISGPKTKVTQPRTSQKRKRKGFQSSKEKIITPSTDCARTALDDGSTRKKTRRNLNDNFQDMLLRKVDVKAHIHFGIGQNILGISVTPDNQVWVNYQKKHVKLFSASGDELRSFDLEYCPVFNCCTPNGDLLVTQGYAGWSSAVIQMISREGTEMMFADLSSYADLLCGVHYQDENMYVIGHRHVPKRYFVLKLNMNGEVEEILETNTECRNINHIISHQGQIIAMCTTEFAMLPIHNGGISARPINKVQLKNTYSASTSVDSLGNVIVASGSKIMIIDLSLEHVFEIDTDIQGTILSTAVDQQNQLWIGTENENLYIVKYLR
uniref:Uncharacterized protein n=1 Tax=Magallana gigas TaxID=29159 RepID=K1PGR1_MAGGI